MQTKVFTITCSLYPQYGKQTYLFTIHVHHLRMDTSKATVTMDANSDKNSFWQVRMSSEEFVGTNACFLMKVITMRVKGDVGIYKMLSVWFECLSKLEIFVQTATIFSETLTFSRDLQPFLAGPVDCGGIFFQFHHGYWHIHQSCARELCLCDMEDKTYHRCSYDNVAEMSFLILAGKCNYLST